MEIENNVVTIQVPNTKFYIVGEKITENTWNVFLVDPKSKRKQMFKKNVTTQSFILFSNLSLRTPFPMKK